VVVECLQNLYDGAFILFALSSEEGCAGGVFEHLPHSVVHFGGTFEVFRCSDFTGNCFTLGIRYVMGGLPPRD
jgi:hypothetical protein